MTVHAADARLLDYVPPPAPLGLKLERGGVDQVLITNRVHARTFYWRAGRLLRLAYGHSVVEHTTANASATVFSGSVDHLASSRQGEPYVVLQDGSFGRLNIDTRVLRPLGRIGTDGWNLGIHGIDDTALIATILRRQLGETHTRRWQLDGDIRWQTSRGLMRLIVDGYYTADAIGAVCRELDDGRVRWQHDLGPTSIIGLVASTGWFQAGTRIVGFDAQSGQLQAEIPIGSKYPVATLDHAGHLHVMTNGGALEDPYAYQCFDLSSGGCELARTPARIHIPYIAQIVAIDDGRLACRTNRGAVAIVKPELATTTLVFDDSARSVRDLAVHGGTLRFVHSPSSSESVGNATLETLASR